MSTVLTYPGVYIEELGSMPLSIASGATAVPAIATSDSAVTGVIRINSWMEFLALVKTFDGAKKTHVAVRSYFINGGGYCYLIPTDKLVAEVPGLDDITLLVAAGENIQEAVATLCVNGASLFAILDGEDKALGDIGAAALSATPHAAVYYPWLSAAWGSDGSAVDVPPSAAVAGAYCTTDRERGVWKAPANVVLRGGLTPKFKVSDELQGQHNSGLALNMLREFDGRGLLIWGARTLEDSDDWRYVPVRRLFSSVEKDVKRSMHTMMFEPNSQATWERVRSAIDNYLHQLWRQGALQGGTPQDAYFVKIGLDQTMTQDDISQGKLIASVGIAAVRPAEFIILQFTQDMGQA